MRPAGPEEFHRVVGRVGRPHGVRGEVGVVVRTDSPEERFVVGAQLAAGPARLLTIASVRTQIVKGGDRLLIRFDGVDDRTAAEALRGTELTIDVRTLPPIEDPDEFGDHELEGLRAVDTSGAELGTVREVLHGAGSDVLVIGGAEGEVLVPFVKEIVPDVDLAAGRLVVDPPEGLFETD